MDHLRVSSRQVIRHKKEIRCATFISASAKKKSFPFCIFSTSLICIRIMIRIVFIFQILCLCSAHFTLHIRIWHWRHFFVEYLWRYGSALLFFKTRVCVKKKLYPCSRAEWSAKSSVRSNPVCGFRIFGGFRWVPSSVSEDEPGFRRAQRMVLSDLGLGSAFFLAKQVWSSSFLKGFEWVRSLVLVDEPGFKWVRSSTFQVRSNHPKLQDLFKFRARRAKSMKISKDLVIYAETIQVLELGSMLPD